MLVNTINFKVNGVTFNNEEGKDIQKEIKRILNEYKKNDYFEELYNGYKNFEIRENDLNVSEYEGYKFPAKLVGDEYKGEECIKIYFKTYNNEYVHIGYAPKENLGELAEWLTKGETKVEGTLEIIGGKYKYCELYEKDYEEKERIAIKELTYGIEITLNFYTENKEIKKLNNENDELIETLKQLSKENNTTNHCKDNMKQDIDISNFIQLIFWIIFGGISTWIIFKILSFANWLFN